MRSLRIKRLKIALMAWLLFSVLPSIMQASDAGRGDLITLPNGYKYRFSGITFGTNHEHGPVGARLVSSLPDPAEDFIKKQLGNRVGQVESVHTSEPSICIWFDPVKAEAKATNSQPYYIIAMMADAAGTFAGTYDEIGAAPNQPFHLLFWAAPRRDSKLEVAFFRVLNMNQAGINANQPGGEIGRVRVPNALHGRYPQWQPDTPATGVKVVGDVEVHLSNFLSGVTYQTNGGRASRPARPGEEATTSFDVSLRTRKGEKGTWVIDRVELSDATGNHLFENLDTVRRYQSQNWIRGSLWPDEGAWSLKMGLKRRVPAVLSTGASRQKFVPEDYGLSSEELLTFSNVPVLSASATNDLWFTNSVGGTRVIMREYVTETILRQKIGSITQPNSALKFHAESADGSKGISVDFLEATSPEGERQTAQTDVMITTGLVIGPRGLPLALNQPISRDHGYVVTEMQRPAAPVTAVNVTWVVQRTRPVEFLLKPPGR